MFDVGVSIAVVGLGLSVAGWIVTILKVAASAAAFAARLEEVVGRLESAATELGEDVKKLLEYSARSDERHRALERRVRRLEGVLE